MHLIDEVAAEVERQDAKHGPFTAASPLGAARLAIACLEDEVQEVKDAWRAERREPHWQQTEAELIQVAAVAMRAVRDLRVGWVHSPLETQE